MGIIIEGIVKKRIKPKQFSNASLGCSFGIYAIGGVFTYNVLDPLRLLVTRSTIAEVCSIEFPNLSLRSGQATATID